MTTLYTLKWHSLERVFEAHLLGSWTLADVEPYFTDLAQQVASNAATGSALLVDLSDWAVQIGPVADAVQTLLTRLRTSETFSRAAVVLSSRAVAVMQTKRISSGSSAADSLYYPDRASAWTALTAVGSTA